MDVEAGDRYSALELSQCLIFWNPQKDRPLKTHMHNPANHNVGGLDFVLECVFLAGQHALCGSFHSL